MSNVIEVRNLTKKYGKSRGVTKLNLNVEKNDFFGFIGPNGAGKSTTIRTILGLIKPTLGTAEVFGMDSLKFRDKILREVGYMPSEAMFYNGMKVEEIINFSARLRNENCTKEVKILCDRLQLDLKKRVEELSLGNRKKVSIICALQHKPKLYILDEPTSGLDPLMQKEFFSLLKERQKEGATIFLSSHILSEIQHYCTKAAIIREGRLIVQDSVESFIGKATKQVNIHGITHLPDIKEIKKAEISGDSVSFIYDGEIKNLISALSGLDIKDMTITEPDLETIFMDIYKTGGEANDNI
ncbi:ABC transporter ATP-binding protein [Clostridium cadaveris]|uniref:ABC-2 type transport system ATP-binding protein n=1 Tax=Clostridium cadaveris TaxID=1529 RepID=A0A1I2L086_9CLOT|nr:ABC transporter ATP-binding protein [Clostridium cadaveris]MDM8313518.1 ABC transporter ATP-binding protein [Clostridium cadaveris]NME63603.1 ABC transporter ATP-binding protein [Clostridium cadaveris]SFF72615.1 ABC-2 type transport system ATP-binding protein [Clostridium cadaveris]